MEHAASLMNHYAAGKRWFNSISAITRAQGKLQGLRSRREGIFECADEVEVEDAVEMASWYLLWCCRTLG